MFASRRVAPLLLLGLIAPLAAPARASSVTASTPSILGPVGISGPGGVGGEIPISGNSLNATLYYMAVDSIDMTFRVDGPGTIHVDGNFNNLAPGTWTSFRFDLLDAPAGTAFTGASSDAFAATAPPLTTPQTGFAFISGSVPGSFLPQTTLDVADAGRITIRLTPIILGAAVPGPSTLALALEGIAGAAALLRWRRARGASGVSRRRR
jgi:hypothetical protein